MENECDRDPDAIEDSIVYPIAITAFGLLLNYPMLAGLMRRAAVSH